MAYATAPFGYQHPQPEFAIDSEPHPLYDDDGDAPDMINSALLDPGILSSPAPPLRRISNATHSGVISPTESQGWEPQFSGSGEASSTVPSNTFGIRPGDPRGQTFVGQPQPPQWAFEQGSGHCTPTTAADPLYHGQPPSVDLHVGPQYHPSHGEVRHGHYIQPMPQHPPPPFDLQQPLDQQYVAAPHVQTPMSPHSHQDYMAFAANEAENRGVSRRMRPASPPRTSVDAQRRDGIRKKNGRIEIPQERNIQKIDQLLERAQDEDLVKELKQQKRLLRNREAALASRQRKKKHTEDLESREKDYSQRFQNYEHQILELRSLLQDRDHQIRGLSHRGHELQRQLDIKDEDARQTQLRHNEETSVLRKRIQLLTEDLEIGQAPAMSAVPSSTGFTDFNAGMEALSVDTADFDEWFQLDHSDDVALSVPDPTLPQTIPRTPDASTLVPVPHQKTSEGSQDPQVASGLLFFLLLCGAFVASTPGNFNPSDLPEVPDDVRAAAPVVLNDLLSESTSMPTLTAWGDKRRDSTLDSHPDSRNNPLSRSRNSRLDRMHRRITSPTKQQEITSAFSLTTAQFASISDPDFHSHDEHGLPLQHSTPQPRHQRSVAEALTQNRNDNAGNSRADVYTRSLLMDKVSPHVVQQFRELVRDYREIETRHERQVDVDEDHPHGHGFKIEM